MGVLFISQPLIVSFMFDYILPHSATNVEKLNVFPDKSIASVAILNDHSAKSLHLSVIKPHTLCINLPANDKTLSIMA